MDKFFDDFEAVDRSVWEAKLQADLRGKDPSILQIHNTIEEIQFASFHHKSERKGLESSPGLYPFTRGMKRSNNQWHNLVRLEVHDETIANKKSLDLLMKGATGIHFVIKKDRINWTQLFNKIGTEHIEVQISLLNIQQLEDARSIEGGGQINSDFVDGFKMEDLVSISSSLKQNQSRIALVNGQGIHSVGANTWQEIAYCLSAGNAYLGALIENGLTIDEAAACISFRVGVGSNYFFELAKIRALKNTWAQIIKAYVPEHNCTYNCSITATIGHLNKSGKDPYTNLLRQTTEAMSALSAGVDSIEVLPYDHYHQSQTELAQRMAVNIPLILQEESYFADVIDPAGGAYSIELLTQEIAQKAWSYFQELEKFGGISSNEALDQLRKDVQAKREERIKLYASGNMTLIGMNKFENPDTMNNSWKDSESYLGVETLRFEQVEINSPA